MSCLSVCFARVSNANERWMDIGEDGLHNSSESHSFNLFGRSIRWWSIRTTSMALPVVVR